MALFKESLINLTKTKLNDFLTSAVVQPLLGDFSLDWFLKMMLQGLTARSQANKEKIVHKTTIITLSDIIENGLRKTCFLDKKSYSGIFTGLGLC